MKTRRIAALAALLALATPAVAAQDVPGSFQVEQFEPMPAQGVNTLNVAQSRVLGAWTPSFGLFGHYVDDPLQVVDEEGNVETRLIDSQLKTELWAALGMFGFADLGVVLPLVVSQSGEAPSAFEAPAVSGFAAGDLRIVPKIRILDPEMMGGLGLALGGIVWVPTGDTATFNSDGVVRGEPRLIVDLDLGGVVLGANAAVQFRKTTVAQNYTSGDLVRWSGALRVPFGASGLDLVGAIFGSASLEEGRDPADLDQPAANALARPIETDLGVQYALPANLVALVGAGTGLNESVGAPNLRVFASLGYTPLAADADRDGIPDSRDQCPDEPEDADGFEDADGCPDVDNDADGILDVSDRCPDEPEDVDGFEDSDGCPDPDNDGDGIADVDDRCPMEPGVPAKEGCPYTDDDGDGLLDDVDRCPDQPEDFDGFEDEDGCPDLDNDRDGIPDADDECPNEPETINGNEDEDGCPDKGKTKVRVTKTKIEILEKVFFDTNKATIKRVSHSILNQVASVLKAYPEITLIRIEGHTDSRGRDEYNLELSERRAAAVKTYLVERGVPAERLVSRGVGEAQPVATNETAGGREQNRRVEFTIVEVNDRPVGEEGATIETREPVE